ncbi:hypothetical protein TanjilG_12536 [Lupinus angustifolius]|uniref:RING-type E3 ubiquitin transferase n=1 Tax=Lupinus angustifolius TaxID=3871 RepID=A0A4P1QYM1_LUPAN|nr:hypothetical protein TanjilG_12536 [Lupinus angustifolius]
MWLPKNNTEMKDGVNGLIAVAIDKEKGSQNALKWAIDHLLNRSSIVFLIHVKLKPASLSPSPSLYSLRSGANSGDEGSVARTDPDVLNKTIFLPYRVFCTRKDIQCKDVLLENVDVPKALIEYVSNTGIQHLVLGSSTKTGLLKRFKVSDIPGTISKGAPDFCTVYVVAKGKIQSMRSATRPAPVVPTILSNVSEGSVRSEPLEPNVPVAAASVKEYEWRSSNATNESQEVIESFRSPFTRKGYSGRSYAESSIPDSDISFVSSGRPSIDCMFPSLYSNSDTTTSNSRLSYSSDNDGNNSFESMHYDRRSVEVGTPSEFSSVSFESDKNSGSTSQAMDDVEAEMRRLKLELKQTMEMYNTACKEALTAQQKAVELQRWKLEEERRLEEARLAEEAALMIAEKEKAKSRAAIEAAEAQKRIAELEAQKRLNAEMKALKEADAKKRALDALGNIDVRYRRYSIEDIEAATEFFTESLKIGEGGYGPVFKCLLDHTPVAVKVLRPDAAQGRSQFQREVEVLSCIRHPNMVLLLGACPEYGCLVYEYMANGSLDDRLFRRGNTPPLPWQVRFKIAAEIGTGLLFLHQTKPEPLVHRDLKPANILLDNNYVSKISDVDPEYQQTGMLGVKSDIYSLGIIFLQILTAKSPMGLAHHVEGAIEKGTFSEMLDPTVPDWPEEETLSFAKMAVQCAELRRRDRPDLGKVVLPELNKLREIAECSNLHSVLGGCVNVHQQSQVSLQLYIPPNGDKCLVVVILEYSTILLL